MLDILSVVLTWILFFYFYSVFGWIFESTYCTVRSRPVKFVNRGFCFGPVCPIYGVSFIVVMILIHPFKGLNLFEQFLLIASICAIVEYLASYILEKIFHVRWWSYHTSWYNFTIGGRVTFWTTIGFGICGTAVINFLHPNVASIVTALGFELKLLLVAILSGIFLIDSIMSSAVASSAKYVFKGGKVDLTAEIKNYAYSYYKKQNRKARRTAKKAIRPVRKAAKKSVKGLKGAQRKIQKRVAKVEYRTKRREMKKTAAESSIKTVRKKSERMKKNSKVDLSQK